MKKVQQAESYQGNFTQDSLPSAVQENSFQLQDHQDTKRLRKIVILVALLLGFAIFSLYLVYTLKVVDKSVSLSDNHNNMSIKDQGNQIKNIDDSQDSELLNPNFYRNRNWYKPSNPLCTPSNKLTVQKLPEDYTLFSTIYKEVFIVEKQTFNLKNGTLCPQVIEWSRKNIAEGGKVIYGMENQLLMVMLGKFLGPKGKLIVQAPIQRKKLIEKNKILNNIGSILKIAQPQSFKIDEGSVLFGGETWMQKKQIIQGKFHNITLVLYLKNTQQNKEFIKKQLQHGAIIQKIVSQNNDVCSQVKTIGVELDQIVEGFYIVRSSIKQSQNIILQHTNRKWFNSKKSVCSPSYTPAQLDPAFGISNTPYQQVFILQSKGQKFSQNSNDPKVIEWSRTNLKQGNKVIYEGQSLLVPIMLAKFVGANGKVIVTQKAEMHKATQKNAIFNNVWAVVDLQTDWDDNFGQIDVLISSNPQRIDKVLNNQQKNINTRILFDIKAYIQGTNNIQSILSKFEVQLLEQLGNICDSPTLKPMKSAEGIVQGMGLISVITQKSQPNITDYEEKSQNHQSRP